MRRLPRFEIVVVCCIVVVFNLCDFVLQVIVVMLVTVVERRCDCWLLGHGL